MVTGIVHDLDTGLHVLYVYQRGRWRPLAAGQIGKPEVFDYDGSEYDLPVHVEGDLNRARDVAVKRAKVSASYFTQSYPASTIDVKA